MVLGVVRFMLLLLMETVISSWASGLAEFFDRRTMVRGGQVSAIRSDQSRHLQQAKMAKYLLWGVMSCIQLITATHGKKTTECQLPTLARSIFSMTTISLREHWAVVCTAQLIMLCLGQVQVALA